MESPAEVLSSNVVEMSSLQLLQRFEAVREAERKRLSRELHDQVGQDLVALSLELRSLKKKVALDSEAADQLEQAEEIVSLLDQRIHDFAWQLRPLILDDLGFQVALLSLIEKWSAKSGIKVAFQCLERNQLKLPSDVESGLYRIVQESLINISKHSNASSVNVVIKFQSNLLTMVIKDNGRGFDLASVSDKVATGGSFGLLGMLERAELIGGVLDISSKSNYGTTIKVSVPLYPRKKGRYVKTTHLPC
ncbi:MAG: sensor histidine kinase [Acidobacteriota bacterium]|nr:sensor histidine kinase [Acidobacteriota bacterium]